MKPEYGKVIVGYPCVGKSALAYNHDFVIDLESSLFNVNGKRPECWEIQYCNVARWLCRCGFTVCVSSHKEVRNELARKQADEQYIVYPAQELKDEWLRILAIRNALSSSEKDHAAYEYVKEHYDENISDMMAETEFKHIVIRDMGYYLAEMIGIID